MASKDNMALLGVAAVMVLLALVVAVGAGLVFYMTPSVPEDSTQAAEAVSVGVTTPEVETPKVAKPAAGLEPVFTEPEETEGNEFDVPSYVITPERFKEQSTKEILAMMSYSRLKSAGAYDIRTSLDKSFKMFPPGVTSEDAAVRIDRAVYSGVGAVTYLVNDSLNLVYTSLETPNECKASWGGPGDWDFFNERCKYFIYNELVRMKYGRPLYKDVAEIDPKTLEMVFEDLGTIEADTPMLGSSAAHVYQAVAPAVHDYVKVWEAMQRGGKAKKMYAIYKRKLKKRGVLSSGNATRDMASLYYDLYEDHMDRPEGLHDDSYVHTIVGFWMRRMHDGTAKDVLEFMKANEAKFGH